jgi:isocitrate dehydrogenase kinase/phosphatase
MARDPKTIAGCAQLIFEGFQRYDENFVRVTDRARRRFEQRDWKGHQQDTVDRVELYEKSVRRIVATMQKNLGRAPPTTRSGTTSVSITGSALPESPIPAS